MYPVRSAVTATAPYPAASLKPIASPRRAGPTRSIFITIVVDQVSPWLTPSRTFAKTTHSHVGAKIRMSGTGTPMSQPATSTGLRPYRSDSAPAARFVAAFVNPKAMRNVSADATPVSPKTSTARSGRTVRSCPTIAPTSPLIATSNANWPAFARRPSRNEVLDRPAVTRAG